jgi:hypothetical protein
MFVIVVRTHGGEAFEALRETREGAERYEKALHQGGISLPGRWLNPSNILEVNIYEEDAESSEEPKVTNDAGSVADDAAAGKRKPRGAVRRVSKQGR